MSDETKQYLSDICSTALYAIGNNVLTNTETRTVPPTSMPVVISSPSSSVQEATTQTTSAPFISQDISLPSGQQSETSTANQITPSPTMATSESTSLVSEANITESDEKDDEGIEEEGTTTTLATISSGTGGTSTIAVGLLPEDMEEDNDTVVEDNPDTEVDNGGLELENTEESDSTEDTSKGIVDKSSSEEEDTTDGDGLSIGAIIGIIIVVVVVPLAIVYLGHRRRQQKQDREELARMESTL